MKVGFTTTNQTPNNNLNPILGFRDQNPWYFVNTRIDFRNAFSHAQGKKGRFETRADP